MTERLLTYKDLMERLSVGEAKARSLMRQMSCINVSASTLKPQYRVTEAAFAAWLNARRAVPEQTEAALMAAAAPKPKRRRGWTYQGGGKQIV